jgi:alkylhydroperoxidase family enzyme
MAAFLFALWLLSADEPRSTNPPVDASPVGTEPARSGAGDSAAASPRATFPALLDAEAWAALPSRLQGSPAPLPLWACTLAKTLPRTTAAMLELDYAHRAASPLAPKLRAQIRWAAAAALHSPYGQAYALADLRQAKVSEDEIRALTSNSDALPEETRRVLSFVRRLSTSASTLKDEEVADINSRFGEKQIVAIVFCVAYANYLDRLALALDLPVEAGGPRPPLDVRFAKRWLALEPAAPARPRFTSLAAPAAVDSSGLKDPDWNANDLPDLLCNVTARKARRCRIALPAVDPTANRWGLVGQTYQPALATAWSACTQAFAEEADQEPVFEQSLFWVVTRTKQCYYCMGHTEMMFTVAGLSRKAIDARLRLLAGADWAALPPADRTALQFAHKQARDPASIEPRDVRALVAACGPERALDAIWWSCRCHYMMCVADAFLLPLESINVFDGFDPAIMHLASPAK